VASGDFALGPTTALPDGTAVTARSAEVAPAVTEDANRRVEASARTKVIVALPQAKPAKFSIREEIDLLDRARSELARGERAAARQLVDEYLSRFPNGELRNEARLIRRDALRTE
jgi:hypothetical protein